MTGSALAPQLIDAIEAGACVLTPNQRTAHWLKLRYAQHALEQGRGAWLTPDIQSFNAFVLQCWRLHGCTPERVLTADQGRLVWERVVSVSAWSEQLLSPQAAANAAYRSWERMQLWRIDRDALLRSTDAANSDEGRALLEWSDRFTAVCRERSWLPVQQLAERLLQVTDDMRTLHVATMDGGLPPSHAVLLQRLAVLGARWQKVEPVLHAGRVNVRACESPEAEIVCAAQWASQQLAAGKRSIAVVVPSLDEDAQRIRRVFADTFAQATRTFAAETRTESALQNASFTIAGYRKLADFPLTRSALDVLELAAGQAGSALAGTVLRSPFLRGSATEAAHRALAELRLRKQVRERYDFAALERTVTATECVSLARCFREAQSLRLGAPSRALPSSHAEHFVALWQAVGWPGEQALDSDEQQIAARTQEALAEFGALDELLGQLTFAAAVREFEQLARTTSFEPRSTPAPIAIVDTQGVDGMAFDAAWVLGLDETRWPPSASPDPFIPIALQAHVGIQSATAESAREQARLRFRQLQTIAIDIVFSWARKDEDIDIQPSPWLRELGDATDTSAVSDDYAARMFVSRPALELWTETAAPQIVKSYVRGGARIFELQSQCPFRAFAELRLGARPLDEVAPTIDARERGTLVHAAFAEVWQILGGSQALHERTDAELEMLVRTSLARHAAPMLEGASARRLRMMQIEIELSAERILSLMQLDRERAPFRVLGTPETKEIANVGALSLELRLDRVDELLGDAHGGERVIVDYKTGNNVKAGSWVSDRPEQPQLPLYAVTHPDKLAAVTFAIVGAQYVGYRGAARSEDILPGIKAFNSHHLAPNGDWNDLLAHWQIVIERLATEFASGVATVDPLTNACRYCHLSAVCRVSEQTEAGRVVLEGEIEDET